MVFSNTKKDCQILSILFSIEIIISSAGTKIIMSVIFFLPGPVFSM